MTRRNLCSNPSLETNNTGWSASGTSGGVTRQAGTWGVGSWYGRIQASSTTEPVIFFGLSTYVIAAVPDDRAFVSIKLRADNAGGEGKRAWIRVDWRDASNAVLGFESGPVIYLTSNPQTAYLLLSNHAPPNTASALIRIMFDGADGWVAGNQVGFDALDVRLNEAPDTYFDGTFANARFEGTEHASPSIRVAPMAFANPKQWKSGGVQVEGLLYRCDANNTRLDDLSRYIKSGRVTWNADKGPGQKLTGEFVLNRRGLLSTYVDFVAPVLRLSWYDGTVEEKQFGLFLCDFPNDALFQAYAEQGVTGLDPTWFPWNSPIRDTINYASSDNVVSKMRDLIVGSGWSRVTFPTNSRTFGADKSLFPGRRRYRAAADQFEAMNWYVPFPDLVGNIRSMPYLDMARVTPAITIDYEDFVGEWRVMPTTTTLANVVAVYKENTAGAGTPISSVAVNADPSSKISTVYRPEILRELTNAEIQTQAEADLLVLQMLAESRSYYRVISGKLSPGVWMEPYCAADVYLEHENWGNLSGRYYVREWVVNFTQDDAEVSVEMNRMVLFGSAEDR